MENKTIKIEGVETKSGIIGKGDRKGEKWVKRTVLTSDEKFSFFTTKANGEDTKANAFYKEVRSKWQDKFDEGDTVEISVMYDEEEVKFTGDTGDEVKYMAKNLKAFIEADAQPSNDSGEEQVPPPEEEINPDNVEF